MDQKTENPQEQQNVQPAGVPSIPTGGETPAPAPAQPKQIFRKESIDRISSPEQLTDYLRVTNPSTWLILAAAIVLLAGMLVWSCVGYLETVVRTNGTAVNGQLEIVVPVKDADGVKAGMPVRIQNTEAVILDTAQDDYGRTIAHAAASVPNGEYPVEIVTEQLNPITFLINKK
ncbi:MAG: hypothetical protein K6F80_06320 [Oscillospiraceae bacterium]|nr:hypothetical protein [Oscillospiraceae bacterium]